MHNLARNKFFVYYFNFHILTVLKVIEYILTYNNSIDTFRRLIINKHSYELRIDQINILIPVKCE